MNRKTLQKIGGFSVITGAVLLALWTISWSFLLPKLADVGDFSLMVTDPDWIWISATALFALIFLIFGFTAVYSRICEKNGINSLAGYVFLLLALILQFAKVTWEVFIYPVIAGQASALLRDRLLIDSPGVGIFRLCAMISILLGVIIFTVAIIRSKDYPLPAALLFLCGAILYGVGPMINVWIAIVGVILFSAGCIWFGITLLEIKKKA